MSGSLDKMIGDGEFYELPTDLELVVTDPKAVVWRKQRLVGMGFTMRQAEAASTRQEADLHRIGKLLDDGCSHETALRIFGVDVPPEEPIEAELAAIEPRHRPEYGEADAA